MKRNKNVKRFVAVIILLSILVVLLQLQKNSDICEFFSTTVSRAWIAVFGSLFGLLPFSMYELLLVVVIAFGITSVVIIIVSLCKRKWSRAFSMVLIVAIIGLSIADIYSLTASFAYNRNSLPDSIYTEYSAEDFSYEQAVDMAEKIVGELNETYTQIPHDENGNAIMPSIDELNDILSEEYKRLTDDYFSLYTPRAKHIVNKTIMSEMHIVGVFFAPFGEANINGNETSMYLPHTMAHELAHGKGVMRENEANLVASYLLLTSDNAYLRYSGLVKTFYSSITLVSLYPNSMREYARLVDMVDDGVFAEMSNYNKFWAQFTLLDDIGNWFNDIYLKLHKQTGTDSYYKPSESEGTGEKDDDGQEIVVIINFSDIQNLLIGLYKQGQW